MLKNSPEVQIGNDRFEGYAVDLILELSQLLGFKYEFILQEDGHYGKLINNITNQWDGMINEVMSGRADIAIADLTVTYDRAKVLEINFIIQIHLSSIHITVACLQHSTFILIHSS